MERGTRIELAYLGWEGKERHAKTIENTRKNEFLCHRNVSAYFFVSPVLSKSSSKICAAASHASCEKCV